MADTIYVRRANVVLKITEAEKDRYIAQGYDILDAEGNVIKKSVPTDVKTLQRTFVEHEQEITKLKAELQALRLVLKEQETAEPEETAEPVMAEPVKESKPKRKAKEVSVE